MSSVQGGSSGLCGLHSGHSPQIERQARELPLGLDAVQPPQVELTELQGSARCLPACGALQSLHVVSVGVFAGAVPKGAWRSYNQPSVAFGDRNLDARAGIELKIIRLDPVTEDHAALRHQRSHHEPPFGRLRRAIRLVLSDSVVEIGAQMLDVEPRLLARVMPRERAQ